MNRIPSAPWLGWPVVSGMSPSVIASRSTFSLAACAGAGPMDCTAGKIAADAPARRNERLSIVSSSRRIVVADLSKQLACHLLPQNWTPGGPSLNLHAQDAGGLLLV